ncbi:MAG: autotransporter domain-containing protein [Proteobacteria bacterium]|nr:autotransporter domain-containing protein [Pseudomonadota bacterium]MBU1582040.1 autotransporter domain-containing protein [Pseudomonadota bacterium]MBU2630466.1 autotransporter domain-containing protein [Pseudomonadota bacterium]
MRKFLIVFFIFLFCNVAVADTARETATDTGLRDGPFYVSIGAQTYYYEYEEPGVMKNEGWFYGIAYSVSYEEDVLIKLDGAVAFGWVDYTSTSSGSSDDIKDIMADTRGILGYSIYNNENTKITPFIGLGYRFLEDDSSNELTTTNNIGYLRESKYWYSPIGVSIEFKLGNGWTIIPEAEYDFFWSGEQKSYLGYLAGYEDIVNEQEEGYGYRFSLAFEKKTDMRSYGFGIFYRYWNIDDSDITIDRWGRGWIEPKNDTSEFGLSVTIIF